MTVETYKIVVASDRGTLNWIASSPDERDSDPLEVRYAKRKRSAEQMAQTWQHNYFKQTETLLIVPCDRFGNPVRTTVPQDDTQPPL